MNQDFKGKKFLVTGCNSGIGKETTLQLIRGGAEVIGVARDQARLQEMQNLCGASGKFFSIDLSEDGSLQKLVDECSELDGVVHSAASVDVLVPIRNLRAEEWEKTLKINMTVPIFLTQMLLKKRSLKNGGSIVFISSIAGQRPQKGQLIYGVSKAGIENAVRSFAKEFAATKIRFNAVAPGLIQSEVFKKSLGTTIDPQDVENYRKRYPLDFGEVSDVVGSILFLLKDESRWMTGQSITLDGGYTIT